jgi:hypothetical protein
MYAVVWGKLECPDATTMRYMRDTVEERMRREIDKEPTLKCNCRIVKLRVTEVVPKKRRKTKP